MPVYHKTIETQLLSHARQFHAWGANVAAIQRGTKYPAHEWKVFQKQRQTADEVEALPWGNAGALAILNGIGDWRVFDIDAAKAPDGQPLAAVDEGVLVALLAALGLPDDYQWSYVSGSGAGFGVVIRCPGPLAGFTDAKGVYIGDPLPGYSFGQLELRWATGLTIIAGGHPTGPGYRWRWAEGEDRIVAPALLSPDKVQSGFAAIAYQGGRGSITSPPSPAQSNGGHMSGAGIFANMGQPAPAPAPKRGYGAGAINDAIRQVSTATAGNRNNTLFAQTTALVELANGGQVAPDEVERAMRGAGLAAGLPADEVEATIKSAFAKVGNKARQAPPPKAPQSPKNAPQSGAASKARAKTPTAKKAPQSGDPIAAPLDPSHEYRLDDTGNAERFAARYRESVRYDHSSGHWFVWAGTHWRRDDNGATQRLAKDTVYSLYQEATEAYSLGQDDRASVIGKWARTSSGEARRNAMLNLARSERPLAITHDQLNNDSNLLNCQNGTLDLTTGELYPHDRDDLIAYCLPFDFDPDAPAPLWDAFIETITGGDRQLANYLARAVGYTLGGERNEQCLFFLYGFGANGKSTFLETVLALLGDLGIKTRAQNLLQEERNRIPNEIAALAGRRMVVTSELSDGNRLNEGIVKDMTGGDTLSARFLHKESFNFRATFRLWMYGNHKPIITGTDNGIWRRIRLIPFTVQIPEDKQDPDLGAKLREELPGILAWAIRGRRDYQSHGLADPPAVKAATADYRKDSDTLGQFLDDACMIGPNFSASGGDLYAAYVAWATANGLNALSNVRFGRTLAERGLTKMRDNVGRWVYSGIGLIV